MDPVYPRFAIADAEFYDDPRRAPNHKATIFSVPPRLSWAEWAQTEDGHWTYYAPRGRNLPEQGWKIHVSTTSANAAVTLERVASYCHSRLMSFKHLANDRVLSAMNSKDADRTASGKFITVYTTNDEELRDALEAIEALIDGLPGPYILSDLRWRASSIFVRYGGFRRLFVDVDGVAMPAIRDPGGNLVPDARETSFRIPSWVNIPDFLAASLTEQMNAVPPPGFPTVTRVLHHSNAGGVYEAIDAGRAVALKEARPFAGLTPDGRDATTRIADETAVLDAIKHPGVVRAIRSFEVLDHRYLITERIDGLPLSKAVLSRHPLVRAHPSKSEVRAFRDWALKLAEAVDDTVAAVHSAGYTHGDLHPGNFMVRDDGRVVLIDFEMARPVQRDASGVIGAPGFVATDGRRGIALDRYAVGCIKLFMFLPLTPLLDLHPPKVEQLISWAVERFELPSRWADEVRAAVFPVRDGSTPPLAKLRLEAHIAQLGAQLLADATPERFDRLWPNDPAAITEPEYAVAHGAFGPLLALRRARIPIPEELVDWAERSFQSSEEPRPGLMDGLAGAAVALTELGRNAASREALDRLSSLNLDTAPPHLYGGLAGLGLAYTRLNSFDSSLLDSALNIADRLDHQRALWHRISAGPVATGAAGIMRGPSGIALFAVELFDRTGDRSLLELAEEAIRADLRSCVPGPDGSLLVDEGWRLLPYLGSGSAGIAYAIAQLLNRLPETDLRQELEALTLAAQTEFVLESGLLQGRVGLVVLLAELERLGFASPTQSLTPDKHIELLALHAIPRPHGIGYPGRALLRRSCDFATGSAGLLFTLAGLRDRADPSIPSDAPPSRLRDRRTEGGETHGIPAFVAGAGAA